ncbi:MAG: DNA recombination protein RmuC [Bryobacteraceae bacterium]
MTSGWIVLIIALISAVCLAIYGYTQAARWRSDAAHALAEAERARADAARLQADLDRMVGIRESLDRDLSQTRVDAARLQVELYKTEEFAAAQVVLLTTAQKQLEEKFRSLAAEALQANSQMFLDRTRDQLEGFVKPVGESLQLFQARVQELEKARVGAYEGIRAQIQGLSSAQKDLQQSTDQLKNALRSPSQRGRWGELQLRSTVELSGMVEHCDFVQQETLFGDRVRRPDMIVKLPNGRQIAVDAKVSLDAYLKATEAEGSQRDAFLNDHARQVKTHIKMLSEKSYWDGLQGSPEFVIAFLPLESIYSAALERDPSLLNFGVERHVLLATPTTLIALLFAVAYGWKERQLAQNAEEIREIGGALYKNLLIMQGRIERVGSALGTAVNAYNEAVTSLDGRVLANARKLHELRAGTGEAIERLETLDVQTRALSAPDWADSTPNIVQVASNQ